MMQNRVYELVLNPKAINFAPSTLAEEVLQNVLTVCTTAKFSVPMDREFGVQEVFIDEPVNSARAKFTQEMILAVRKFEPRARISRVEFRGDYDGGVFPRVFVKIVEP